MAKAKQNNAYIMQNLNSPDSLITQAFAGFTPPQGPFDPDGDWTHVYHDISSLRRDWIQGGLTLKHGKGGSLHIESFRNCPQGYRYWTQAVLICKTDSWTTPVSWKVESKVAKKADDSPYLDSGLKIQAHVKDGTLTLAKGSDKRTRPLSGEYTCKWCLMDAVGRMAKHGRKDMLFTMLDEYDEPCPDQRIEFREETKAKTRNGSIEIICYQHTGTAAMPGLFYVDTFGRVLFYLAGMQLLALASSNRVETGYLK